MSIFKHSKGDSFKDNGLTQTGGKIITSRQNEVINGGQPHATVGWTLDQVRQRYGDDNLEKIETYHFSEELIANSSKENPMPEEVLAKILAPAKEKDKHLVSTYAVDGVYRWDLPGKMDFVFDENNLVVEANWAADILVVIDLGYVDNILNEINAVYGQGVKSGDDETSYQWAWASTDGIDITFNMDIDSSGATNKATHLYLTSELHSLSQSTV